MSLLEDHVQASNQMNTENLWSYNHSQSISQESVELSKPFVSSLSINYALDLIIFHNFDLLSNEEHSKICQHHCSFSAYSEGAFNL